MVYHCTLRSKFSTAQRSGGYQRVLVPFFRGLGYPTGTDHSLPFSRVPYLRRPLSLVMPPILRRGVPIGQNKVQLPKGSHLCRCWSCYDKISIDPLTNKLVSGAYLDDQNFAAHNQTMRDSSLAPPPGFPDMVGLLTIRPCAISHQDTRPQGYLSSTSDRSLPSPYSLSPTEIMDLLPELKSLLVTFTPLDFALPPTSESEPITKGVDLVLAPDSSANARCIEYERWLWEAHARAETFVASQDPDTKVRGQIVCKDLSNAMSELDELKHREWEGQRVEATPSINDPPTQSTSAFSCCPFSRSPDP